MCFWITLIALLILLAGTPPYYPYSRRWGYGPSAAALFLLLILLIVWWCAWLPVWFYPVQPMAPR